MNDNRETEEAGMQLLELADPVVLVLAEGETPADVNNNRGHLFERFIAKLFHGFGFNEPTRERLNTTANGIELDVHASHALTGDKAIAECKAYSSPVNAAMLGTFHSKLVTRRYTEGNVQGFFIALPRLTANGKEQGDLISAHDPGFKVLTAVSIVELLRQRKIVVDCPISGTLISDPAVVITDHGVYASCIELDPITRIPARVLVWSAKGPVPTPVLEGISRSSYAQDVPAIDARTGDLTSSTLATETSSMIVTVAGSNSDFEYQLPASPKYFIGRKAIVRDLTDALDNKAGVVVLNAQSGWGKSSVALKLKSLVSERGGHALIIDSRTASNRRFVTDALRRAVHEGEVAGILRVREDASWGSLASALRTVAEADWLAGPLVIFFDQFENVFRYEELTREFRDLALSGRDLASRILVGFAWKTDLVGWVEGHPYQLRDEIRSHAKVLTIGPLGAAEVDTLLRRLERELDQALARDLRARLREYSQGLPWLFKKLAGHLIREIRSGATQEQLANEALNVQNLFDADLAELGLLEQEGLRHIAKYAPISISEVMEKVSAPIVESLVNRRLVVQVGERLDTYWDIFRDYLNSGRIPVEDSYILRQSPVSVSRLLREVIRDSGDSSVREIAVRLGTSENGVFNLSRELRLLGATAYEPNRVRILPDIWEAEDRERELRNRIASSLRRHRAFSMFSALAERLGPINVSVYARELPQAFPAIDVKASTWVGYARVYLLWFEYAGLAIQTSGAWMHAPDNSSGVGELFGGRVLRRAKGGFPHDPPGPAIRLLLEIAKGTRLARFNRDAARALMAIGAVRETVNGSFELVDPELVIDGVVASAKLRLLLERVPGVSEGMAVIETSPSATAVEVGEAVKSAIGAEWAASTTESIGKYLRAWAKSAGLVVRRPGRTDESSSNPIQMVIE